MSTAQESNVTAQELADFMNTGWPQPEADWYYDDKNDDLWEQTLQMDPANPERHVAVEPAKLINLNDFEASRSCTRARAKIRRAAKDTAWLQCSANGARRRASTRLSWKFQRAGWMTWLPFSPQSKAKSSHPAEAVRKGYRSWFPCPVEFYTDWRKLVKAIFKTLSKLLGAFGTPTAFQRRAVQGQGSAAARGEFG